MDRTFENFLNYIYDELESDTVKAENNSHALREEEEKLERLYREIRKKLPKKEINLINRYDAQKNNVLSRREDILVKYSLLHFVTLLKELKIL